MTFSKLTRRTVPHHNKYASRRGRGVTRVIVHHWAGTQGGDSRLVNPSADVSTNYILYSDGTLVGQVPEEYRAWTTGSWEADSRSITVEVQNSAVGGQWPVSNAAINKLIELIADVAKRYRWGSVNRSRVRGHREFVATACPGPYLWSRLGSIASQANSRLKGGGGTSTKKGTQVMKHYVRRDLYAGRRTTGRSLAPNHHLYLNEKNNTNSQATNIVGGIGYYSITAHVYAEGTPGESLDLTLMWQDTRKNPRTNSPHYVERLVFDKNGKINANVEFKRHVSRGYAVYARLRAPSTNKNNVKVTMLATDAYLYN